MNRLLILFCISSISILECTSINALPWDKLPYKVYPLIQNGDENIVPPITDTLAGWSVIGDAKYIESGGKQCIRLGPMRNEKASGVEFSASVNPNALYTVLFNFCFTKDAQFDYTSNYPGLHGWIVVSAQEKKDASTWRILEQRNIVNWSTYETSIYTTQHGNKLKFSIYFNGISGYALISDIKIYADKIPKHETRMVISPSEGTLGYEYAEVRKVSTVMEKPKNVTVFHRPDLNNLFFYSIPGQEEVNKPLKITLTPGEVGVATLAIYTPRKLTKLKLKVSELKNSSGKIFLGNQDWKVVYYRPRRVNYYGQGRTWYWVADSFHKALEGIDTNADETSIFWIKINSSPQAISGIYSGNIVVEAFEETLGVIPIEVKVLPFRLSDTANKIRGIYTDIGRWKSLSNAQILNELDDFKAHGINCMLIPSGQPRVVNNKIVGWSFDKESERHMKLIMQSRIGSSFIVWFGWLDKWLANYFNIPKDELYKDPVQWPDYIKNSYKECLIFFKNEFEKRDWGEPVFHAFDEPGYWKEGSPEQFMWKYKVAFDAGLKTYCTSSYLPSDPLGKNLTYHCYAKRVLINSDYTNFALQLTHKSGQKFWYYATGSYSGQIGNMVKNRYLSGFLFFRSNADGIMSWTFQRPHGNPFDDFYTGEHSQPCITYPDLESPGENLDTPQWEGLRQGWIDYKYISTLAEIAKKSTEAKKELGRILDSMPWNGDPFCENGVTNTQCDMWREEIAAEIERYSH